MGRYKLSKRKLEFARFYLDFDRLYSRSLAGNAYRCALQVGYSESYARRILWHMNWKELERLMKTSEIDSKC